MIIGRRPRSIGALLLVAALARAITLGAQTRPPVAEHDVKAAFLFQFGRYVEWPSDGGPASGSFPICVVGEDPFGAALDDVVKGQVISGAPVAIIRIGGLTEAEHCQVLFVSPSEDDRLPAILKALVGREVLTVGEGVRFTQRGGMVAFTMEDRKVRFVVNLAAVEAANLRLSSQLLRVALRVE